MVDELIGVCGLVFVNLVLPAWCGWCGWSRGHPGVWLMGIRLVCVAVCLARQVAPAWSIRVAQTLAGLMPPRVYPQFSPQLRLLAPITSDHPCHPDRHLHPIRIRPPRLQQIDALSQKPPPL